MTMKQHSNESKSLEIAGDAAPVVPTFTCIVYIRKDEDGTLTGRVANLAGIEASGSSERFVLSKIVKDFKARVLLVHEAGDEIPWVSPVPGASENEQIRSIPMHL